MKTPRQFDGESVLLSDLTQYRLCEPRYRNIYVALAHEAPKTQDKSCGTVIAA